MLLYQPLNTYFRWLMTEDPWSHFLSNMGILKIWNPNIVFYSAVACPQRKVGQSLILKLYEFSFTNPYILKSIEILLIFFFSKLMIFLKFAIWQTSGDFPLSSIVTFLDVAQSYGSMHTALLTSIELLLHQLVKNENFSKAHWGGNQGRSSR